MNNQRKFLILAVLVGIAGVGIGAVTIFSMISELYSLIDEVDSDFTDYDPTKASRAISDFVQEKLSNWYVRLCRRRFWKGEYGKDKIAAYQTLHQCLISICQIAAPIAPFYMDHLYQKECHSQNKLQQQYFLMEILLYHGIGL